MRLKGKLAVITAAGSGYGTGPLRCCSHVRVLRSASSTTVRKKCASHS